MTRSCKAAEGSDLNELVAEFGEKVMFMTRSPKKEKIWTFGV